MKQLQSNATENFSFQQKNVSQTFHVYEEIVDASKSVLIDLRLFIERFFIIISLRSFVFVYFVALK